MYSYKLTCGVQPILFSRVLSARLSSLSVCSPTTLSQSIPKYSINSIRLFVVPEPISVIPLTFDLIKLSIALTKSSTCIKSLLWFVLMKGTSFRNILGINILSLALGPYTVVNLIPTLLGGAICSRLYLLMAYGFFHGSCAVDELAYKILVSLKYWNSLWPAITFCSQYSVGLPRLSLTPDKPARCITKSTEYFKSQESKSLPDSLSMQITLWPCSFKNLFKCWPMKPSLPVNNISII